MIIAVTEKEWTARQVRIEIYIEFLKREYKKAKREPHFINLLALAPYDDIVKFEDKERRKRGTL